MDAGSRRSGNATVLVLFLLFGALGVVMMLATRSEGLRVLSTRSRFAEQADALALSAIEEARVRFLTSVNANGTPAYTFARTASPEGASMTLAPEAVQALAASGPQWPAISVDPVSITLAGVKKTAMQGGVETTLDFPYDYGYIGRVRFLARATVDKAERSIAQYFDARLTNLRPPLPCDRIKLFVRSLGGMEPRALGDVLNRVLIDPGPEAPLDAKITSFVLLEEEKMAQSFNPLMPPSGAPAQFPAAAASYIVPTASSMLAFLYPSEGDPTALVAPEGIAVCGEDLALPEWSRFRLHGVIACAGNILVQGLIREIPEGTDESLVLMTLGKDKLLRADERPCEAALLALGDGSKVEPASGTSRLQVHGVIGSAAPSGILTGTLVYDPVQYNGKADGAYRAPGSPGTPAPRPGAGEVEPAAYRFTMASYPVQTVAQKP